jgi:hypothetical protein
MKRPISILLVIALVAVLAAVFWRAQLGSASATFYGPEFHAREATTSAAIFTDFSEHLQKVGFASTDSPSTVDSWVGDDNEGLKRFRFEREESNNQKLYVYADVDEKHVRTSFRWENFGTRKSSDLAERVAYQLALDLDDWFRARTEDNRLPIEIRDKTTAWLTERIADK